jgi:hypothetical protein
MISQVDRDDNDVAAAANSLAASWSWRFRRRLTVFRRPSTIDRYDTAAGLEKHESLCDRYASNHLTFLPWSPRTDARGQPRCDEPGGTGG